MTAVTSEEWLFEDADDTVFRRCLLGVAIPMFVLGVIIPLINLQGADGDVDSDLAPRYARLIESAPEPPEAPAETETPSPSPEPVSEPEPVPTPPKPKPTAREVAARSGVMAFSSQLQELQNLVSTDAVRKTRQVAPENSAASSESAESSETSAISAAATAGSGGTTRQFDSQRASGTRLQEREAAAVDAPVAQPGRKAGSGRSSTASGRRSLDEIQAMFDRNKGGIYTIYNRALRRNPDLKGKILLRLTIAPDGAVTACEIVSSELGDAEVERKVIARVRLINFGAKRVEPITLDYPIYFQPS